MLLENETIFMSFLLIISLIFADYLTDFKKGKHWNFQNLFLHTYFKHEGYGKTRNF